MASGLIGQTISHYRILEQLGQGGMGVVYKAEDTKLKRCAALKFLPPELTRDQEARERFIYEAQAASALDHANICTIYQIDETEDGQMFIVMAYYEGQTLKEKIESGQLPRATVVDIAIQIAQGLAKAHQHGIIHRDIKPANIIVTGDGIAKIVDFGIAKLARQTGMTRVGTAMGTAAYMSPEQARGEVVDQRTDIWALGVVLYEMLTGQMAFKGEYEQAVVYSILNEEPEPIRTLRAEMPLELEWVVTKAMAKRSEERYQNMQQMLTELQSLQKTIAFAVPGKAEPARASIAVLPFVDISPEKDQECFCDGLAEELINALARVEGLRVAARTSAFQFKSKAQDIRKIGEQLNVQTVLEGSVRRAGNKLRVTAQLINVADGFHLWSEKYDREMKDIFDIQAEISWAIVETLRLQLVGGQTPRLVRRHTENPEAYNLYHKGRHFWNNRTEEGLRTGIHYFEQALAEDPGYVLAYAGLADSYNILGFYGSLPPNEAFTKAKAYAVKAVDMDDMVAEAHASLAYARHYYDWDWLAADREYRRAIELNPNYATARQWFALYLAAMGRHDESREEMKRAYELDPLSLVVNVNVGWILYAARLYDDAIEQYRKTLQMDPDFHPAHSLLGVAYERKGMLEQAIAELHKGLELSGGHQVAISELGYAYAMAGLSDEASKMLERLNELSKHKYVSSYIRALICGGLSQIEAAFAWLQKGYEERDSWLVFLKVDPRLDNLRQDQRFVVLLQNLRLAS